MHINETTPFRIINDNDYSYDDFNNYFMMTNTKKIQFLFLRLNQSEPL